MDSNLNKLPKISVLMPVYNCELYIKEAVESILNQTFDDFEFLIIDDASTDDTVNIIKKYTDSRIQLIEKPINTGLTHSLNYGLNIAKGDFIARMDGDDISVLQRFKKQIDFLDANPDVVLCGSFFSIIGTNDVIIVPEDYESIKLTMLKRCCIGHPTVMMRKAIFDKYSLNYDVTKEPAEDYDLWIKLLDKGEIYNIQEVLLYYRLHISQVSVKRQAEQDMKAIETRLNLLVQGCNDLILEELNVISKILSNIKIINFHEIVLFLVVKQKILKSNKIEFFEFNGFNQYLYDLEKFAVRSYFLRNQYYSPLGYLQYLKIRNKLNYKFTVIQEFKFFIKSAIFWKKR